jgi:membrane peptidoglycan carboxypeptidase
LSTPDFTGPGRHGRGSSYDGADGERRQASHRGNGEVRTGARRDYDDSERYGLGNRGGRRDNGYGPDDYDRTGQRGTGRGSRAAGRTAAFEPARRGPFRRRGAAGGDDGGGRGGRPPKRKGSWWRHWTWKKVVGLVLACFGGFIVIGAILIAVAYSDTQIPTDVSALALQQASTVYFNNGKTVVGTFGTTDRQVLSSNQIPNQLKNAVLSAEDRNFYHEGGISLTGIMRAAYEDVTSSGSQLQGGSTITEQFVKNYYLDLGTDQSISGKIKEIFVAAKLARVKSKDWILTNFLNTIYFGDGAYGVGAAAKTFFGVSASQLNVAQDAMIASMLNAPGQFSPVPGQPGYAPLVARWHYVIQGLVTMGDLTSSAASSMTFPKVDTDRPQSSGWTGYNGYIMQAVENELESTYHYTLPEIDNDGLHIVTTFSQPMMNALYSTVNAEKAQMAAAGPGTALPWFAHIGAVLEQPGTGAIVAMYSGPSYSESAAYCKKIDCQDDMALQNREQVGSSFKPYVLSTARAQGMSVKTSVLDGTSPLCVPGDQFPTTYSVPAVNGACPTTPDGWHAFTNDEGDGATGPQSVVNATAQSLNTAYTDLTHRVGTQNVINMAKAFGVNTGSYLNGGSSLQADVGQVGIALGQNALTVEEQANTFAVLANDGGYVTPHVIKQITQGGNLVQAKVDHREVLTPDEASDVDYALSFTTLQGTGTNAEMADHRPMIGKTGTTSTAQSAFFLGAIPQYSFAVGIFTNNQNASTAVGAQTLNNLGGLGGYGGDWPALIWHAYAEKEFAQLPIEQLPTPDFGGSAWNLMGNGQGLQPASTPKPKTTSSPRPTPTCTPRPLQACGTGPTSPPPSSPPPTSPPPTSPPPTCKPLHCHTPAPNPATVMPTPYYPGTTDAIDSRRMGGSG